VLASRNRVRNSAEFSAVVRQGRRVGRPHLVVHLLLDPQLDPATGSAPRAGFVVSKAVGGAVVRHTVTRRLRALVRDRLPSLPAGSVLVVRALPAAATATFADLGADLDGCLSRLVPAGRP
jgi:ribonuclease P protein component